MGGGSEDGDEDEDGEVAPVSTGEEEGEVFSFLVVALAAIGGRSLLEPLRFNVEPPLTADEDGTEPSILASSSGTGAGLHSAAMATLTALAIAPS